MPPVTRIEIGTRPGFRDSRGVSLQQQIRDYLAIPLEAIRTRDVYHIEADLTADEATRIAREFAGPVLRQGAVGRLEDGPFDVAISVGYKPGVTDPVGKSARVAIEDLLGRPLGLHAAVYSSRVTLLSGIDRQQGRRIARELLANELIERVLVESYEEWSQRPPDLRVPRVSEVEPPPVETIALDLSDEELVELSRRRLLALSRSEMLTIRDFYRAHGHDAARRARGLPPWPTDVELEALAQTWSEHCKHKIFAATIECHDDRQPPRTIHSLFKTYVRGTTEAIDRAIQQREGRSWLVSVFHDNAGVIAATEQHHLVYKVETHNSPSALDPYGGAITGIVGVNRDPFGTGIGSDLLTNVWGYCFAPPDFSGELPKGLLHPRRIRGGVHSGVIDGGNQSGIPYGRGWEWFDERFLGKPLVYCGTVGRMPVAVAGRPAHEKGARPGDRVVMVGGRIGKDGIHGATFSSAELTEESPVQAVQIGDPITQKMMFDFLLEARDLGLYSAITDNGAGGLSSSVGEMSSACGGAELELARAPLKYQGLAAWEILLSEAQERMTLAVPPDKLDALLDLARRREVEATDLGSFTASGALHVMHRGQSVGWLPLSFLHDGLPAMQLRAVWTPPAASDWISSPAPADPAATEQLAARFLARHNLRSNERLARTYDHEVKGLSIIKPWIGVRRDIPSDASVFQLVHGRWEGYALAEGVFPSYSDSDAHAMAQAAVDTAVRRVIASGARWDRIAALDNFCWPDPLPGPSNPDAEQKLAQLVRAAAGMSEICIAYGVPLISGKDSMKNDAVLAGRRISIPPTLLISTIALIDDVRRAMTLEAGGADELLLIVGETENELGSTEWAAAVGGHGGAVPRCKPADWAQRYRQVATAIAGGSVTAAHAPSLGGLLPALFRMAWASGVGLDVDLSQLPTSRGPLDWEALLFAESCGRFLLTCRREQLSTLADELGAQPFAVIGQTTAAARLRVFRGIGRTLLDADLAVLARAWGAAV